LQDRDLIAAVEKKLRRISLTEQRHPNKFEQHITDIKAFLINELNRELNKKVICHSKIVSGQAE
jgi:hypothetical protein